MSRSRGNDYDNIRMMADELNRNDSTAPRPSSQQCSNCGRKLLAGTLLIHQRTCRGGGRSSSQLSSRSDSSESISRTGSDLYSEPNSRAPSRTPPLRSNNKAYEDNQMVPSRVRRQSNASERRDNAACSDEYNPQPVQRRASKGYNPPKSNYQQDYEDEEEEYQKPIVKSRGGRMQSQNPSNQAAYDKYNDDYDDQPIRSKSQTSRVPNQRRRSLQKDDDNSYEGQHMKPKGNRVPMKQKQSYQDEDEDEYSPTPTQSRGEGGRAQAPRGMNQKSYQRHDDDYVEQPIRGKASRVPSKQKSNYQQDYEDDEEEYVQKPVARGRGGRTQMQNPSKPQDYNDYDDQAVGARGGRSSASKQIPNGVPLEEVPLKALKGAFQPPPPDDIVDSELLPCPDCGRKFNEISLEKHVRICKKMFCEKRKKFDMTKARVQGTELAEFVLKKKGKRTTETTSKKPAAGGMINGMPKWKAQSLQFRAAMRAANQYAGGSQAPSGGGKQGGGGGSKKGGSASRPRQEEMPPPVPYIDPSYIKCPNCNRSFNEKAAERHIPQCKNIIAKPSRLNAGAKSKTGLSSSVKAPDPVIKQRANPIKPPSGYEADPLPAPLPPKPRSTSNMRSGASANKPSSGGRAGPPPVRRTSSSMR